MDIASRGEIEMKVLSKVQMSSKNAPCFACIERELSAA